MKTKFYTIALFTLVFVTNIMAQDVTTVRANSGDISDNLDLRAVASIFGDSRDLEDFERKLNDPDIQISNLDLNGDNQVDYLRVIEATENNTHLIIIQAVLGRDTFQDVATVEVERDRNNNVQVQVVGDTFMYGNNYMYEPVYVTRPYIYDTFWVSSYRPYYSPWYWGYYPTYYSYWAPYPVYRYRNNLHVHINPRNSYNYVNTGRNPRAAALYTSRRANAYERQNPQQAFTRRNNVNNRYALEQNRAANTRNTSSATRNTATNQTQNRPTGNAVRSNNVNTVRNTNNNAVRNNNSTSPASRSTVSPATNTQQVRYNPALAPARNNDNNAVRTAPAATRSEAQPIRQTRSEAQPVRQINTAPAQRQQSAPAVRHAAPAVRSAPAPQQRSQPVRSAGNATRNSRG